MAGGSGTNKLKNKRSILFNVGVGMKEGNKKKHAVAETGWMPFWWGSKFCKRLAAKRERQKERKEVENENGFYKKVDE